MDPLALLPLVTDLLRDGDVVSVEDAATSEALRQLRPDVAITRSAGPGEDVDVVLLLAGQVSAAGERAPAVLDTAVRSCRPGGHVALAVPSAVWAHLDGRPDEAQDRADRDPGMTADQVAHLLAERGLQALTIAAPGAAAGLAGRPWAGADDLDIDSTSGLRDAGPVILATARTAPTAADRSRTFFSSVARKMAAASVVCTTTDLGPDDEPQVLLVFDLFKDAWTLPGGLVDADESPIDAAVREAREEGGVDVRAGALLGVFAHSHPDRLHLVYAATPVAVDPAPVPLHDHEIGEVRWVTLPQALDLLDDHMTRKLQQCLAEPGRTWHW